MYLRLHYSLILVTTVDYGTTESWNLTTMADDPDDMTTTSYSDMTTETPTSDGKHLPFEHRECAQNSGPLPSSEKHISRESWH